MKKYYLLLSNNTDHRDDDSHKFFAKDSKDAQKKGQKIFVEKYKWTNRWSIRGIVHCSYFK